MSLCHNAVANFVVQSALVNCKQPEQLSLMLEEILPNLQDFLGKFDKSFSCLYELHPLNRNKMKKISPNRRNGEKKNLA